MVTHFNAFNISHFFFAHIIFVCSCVFLFFVFWRKLFSFLFFFSPNIYLHCVLISFHYKFDRETNHVVSINSLDEFSSQNIQNIFFKKNRIHTTACQIVSIHSWENKRRITIVVRYWKKLWSCKHSIRIFDTISHLIHLSTYMEALDCSTNRNRHSNVNRKTRCT